MSCLCTKCGIEYPNRTRFCENCGTPTVEFPQPIPKQTVAVRRAQNSSKAYSPDPNYPMFAGVSGNYPQQNPAQDANQKNKRLLLFALCFFCIVALLGLGIFVGSSLTAKEDAYVHSPQQTDDRLASSEGEQLNDLGTNEQTANGSSDLSNKELPAMATKAPSNGQSVIIVTAPPVPTQIITAPPAPTQIITAQPPPTQIITAQPPPTQIITPPPPPTQIITPPPAPTQIATIEPDYSTVIRTTQTDWSKDYVLNYSSDRSLDESDLRGLTLAQLRIARNEIFARHGRSFKDGLLSEYFNSKSWYRNLSKYTPDQFDRMNMLSDLETANSDFILQYENQVISSTRTIFPESAFVYLQQADVVLSKKMLEKALDEIYTNAGASKGDKSRLGDAARFNVDLIENALRIAS